MSREQPSPVRAKGRASCLMVGLALLLGLTVLENWPRSRLVTLRLTGTPGQPVEGLLVVNGVARRFARQVPDSLQVSAANFGFTVWNRGPEPVETALLIDGRPITAPQIVDGRRGIGGTACFSGFAVPVKWLTTYPVQPVLYAGVTEPRISPAPVPSRTHRARPAARSVVPGAAHP